MAIAHLVLGVIYFALIIVVFAPYAFMPEHYVVDVVFSPVMDVITAFFLVVTVQWMLALERAAAARAEISPAAAMYPAV